MEDVDVLAIPVRDAEYEAWIRHHPRGFIINVKKSSGSAMVWHRADCDHIQPDGTLRFITSAAIKACSSDPGVLAVWAVEQHMPLEYCKDCQYRWRKEHDVAAR